MRVGIERFIGFNPFIPNSFGKLPQNFWSQRNTEVFLSAISPFHWSTRRACNSPAISTLMQSNEWLQFAISVFQRLLSLHRGTPKRKETKLGRQKTHCYFYFSAVCNSTSLSVWCEFHKKWLEFWRFHFVALFSKTKLKSQTFCIQFQAKKYWVLSLWRYTSPWMSVRT